jgi:uncharacterized protein (TIGR02996 family)
VTELEALLLAILDDPADDIPRLVYADWLDDHGDRAGAVRAEFIRLQVESARQSQDRQRVARLNQQSSALWQEHGRDWSDVIPAPLRNGVAFRRGFIDEFRGTARAFFHTDPDQFWRTAPAQVLALSGINAEQSARLAASPPVARLTQLELSSAELPVDVLQKLLNSPHFTRLTTLSLTRLTLEIDEIGSLIAAPLLARLRTLSLRNDEISDAGAERLAGCPALTGLAMLDLTDNEIGNNGALALARSPYLDGLAALHVGWNFIDGEGMVPLRRRFGKRLHVGRQAI